MVTLPFRLYVKLGLCMPADVRSPRPPSMVDVATAAGVSMQTVSRVANGAENVLPATRARVEDVMRQLGYRPNHAARALRSGRTKNIGVIVFTLSSFGNMRTLEAVVNAAAQAKYSISLMSAANRTQSEVAAAFARLREQAVDGALVIVESHILDQAEVELPPDLPVVVIDSSTHSDHSLVDTDQLLGARQATEHLLSLGHHTVWHISGPEGSFSADRREAGWRETLEAAGRPVPPVLQGDWTTEAGYAVGMELARRPEVTAVFASNDQMALGLLRACHELGRPVPSSMSVVGFDDMKESDSFWPPLTTVHQYFDDVGRQGIALLLEAIEHTKEPRQVVIPTTLVIRESTAPPS
jgi:DNA-binding LacI/PurR family transcriptional regulator